MARTDKYLQQALYETLHADASLTALMGGNKVFSQIALNTEFPFILICNWRSEDWSTSSDNGELHHFDFEIWDDAASSLLRQNLGSRIYELLHEQSLELDFGHLVNLRFENSFLSVQDHTKLQPLRLKFRAAIEF
ncbi:MAG: DUF3168 domain-containing protein [Rhizobiaceae bacterium]|nr:DUF3168 domain-containing protein [Rhizobiaceae bacterium]